MQLQSLTVSRLRRTTARGLRALTDALRNQVRHQERPKPQQKQAFPGSRGDSNTGTTVAPPGQRQASEDTAVTHQPAAGIRSRRRGRASAMRPHKYQALVTLYPSGAGGLGAEPPLHVRHMAVRPDHSGQLFSALVSVEDGSLLKPGTADIVARMVVLGDDARDYLAPGEQFALLSGSEVGHGVVSGWLFT